MKINDKHLKELRQCEMYQSILPRYQKVVEWLLKEYIEVTEKENIKTEVYFVTKKDNGSIKMHSPLEVDINQRRLLNLNALDFDFGLNFTSDCFMPFFGENEIALFSSWNNVEENDFGDICLVKFKTLNELFLVTKEENGYFELDGTYLDHGENLEVLGVLINIETK